MRKAHALTRLLFLSIVIVGAASPTAVAISRGRAVLLNRGLQLQAVVFVEDDNDAWPPGYPGFANANRFLDANFTTLNYWHNDMASVKADFAAQVGSRPWQWGRIYQQYFAHELTPGEWDYIDNFVCLQYEDELPQTQAVLDAEKTWFARWKVLYPNALSCTNLNWGTQYVEDYAGLRNYMQYTRPDLLLFDMYPGYDGFVFTPYRSLWYSTMQRYRTVALEGFDGTGNDPLPYGQYLDLWRRGSHPNVFPPESFIRLQQFASWAFGFTFTSAFIYNDSPNGTSGGVYSAMFSAPGDASPTPVFNYVAESNRQSRNLGPALLRLVSTDIRMIPGTGLSLSGTGVSAWDANANGGDNYIASIVPIVSPGGAADTSYKDILIGYFKPLLADNSGYPFADGKHFMIVNGAYADTAAASAQWYRIVFNFGNSGFNALERLNRDTGLVEMVRLTPLGNSRYVLELNLPGGTGDLFRYASGPSVAVIAQDNFDNVAAGSLPSPTVGTWVSAWYNAKAGTGLATPPSGPNYLDQKTLGGGGVYAFEYAVDLAGAALVPGTPVHAEVKLYDMNGYGAWGLIANDYVGNSGPWNWIIKVGFDYHGGHVYAESASGSLVDTGLTYTLNGWDLWQIDYVVGADNYTLTVGGNSAVLGAGYMKNSAATQLAIVKLDTWWSSGARTLADDLLVFAGIPAARVIGTVLPQDYTGDLVDVRVRIELRQNGIPVQTERMALGSSGQIELLNVPTGIYDVAIKSYAHLQKVLANVDVSADPTDLGTIELINGDGDGDNEVTTSDLATVLMNMDQVGD